MQRQRRRCVMVIGGRASKPIHPLVLEAFVRQAGDTAANIVLLSLAHQDQTHETSSIHLLHELGAGSVVSLPIADREDASEPVVLAQVEAASAVLFCGADDLRTTSLLGGTPLAEVLHRAVDRGLLLAGVGPGGAMLSNVTLVTGRHETHPRVADVELSPGLGFLRNLLVDQRFAERGDVGRLLAAVAQNPDYLGLGIDQSTALLVDEDGFEVLGSGAVTVVDGAGLSYTDVADVGPRDCMAIFGVLVHVLPHGYRFDLRRRRPLPERQGAAGSFLGSPAELQR